jgi:hypothetical protein
MANQASTDPLDPVAAWLSEVFPRQHRLSADLDAALRSGPELLLDPPNKAVFGYLAEFAIGLAVCQDDPYPELLRCLDDDRARRILTLAGYRPAPDDLANSPWLRTGPDPHSARLFTAASRLAHLHRLRNNLDARRLDVVDVTRLMVQRWPDLLDPRPDQTSRARRAFRVLWDSFSNGFRNALRSYGPATAQVSLLDGQRCADLLLGTTVLEIKSGRLDDGQYRAGLIRQLLTYALLAPLHGYPVTHVAVYAVRYQRLLRYPVQPFADRLAGDPVNLARAGAALDGLIRQTAHHRPPDQAGPPADVAQPWKGVHG